MINNDRIVPIQKIDFLSMIGTILTLTQNDYTVLKTSSIDGAFSVTEDSDVLLLANQPVKTLDFAAGVTSASVLFVAAYDFAGFTVNGTAVTPLGTVNPDGISLYVATLHVGGGVSITDITPNGV
jgi:hypothetical protein